MRIQNHVAATPAHQQVDITELFLNFKNQHRNVFIYQADNQVFIYRSLGRSEYRKILTDERFDDLMKEELICQVCVLWPEDFDYGESDAGLPTVLRKEILRNSYLDEDMSRTKCLQFYRSEMFDLDNQISCIINEAFPQFDIEEIESWDIDKTTKYLSRAEWKLHNLRGMSFVEPQGDFYGNEVNKQQGKGYNDNRVRTEEVQAVRKEKPKDKTIRGASKGEKLTPDKLRELKAKFPDINWASDAGFSGIEGLAQESIDTTPPALRPGF